MRRVHNLAHISEVVPGRLDARRWRRGTLRLVFTASLKTSREHDLMRERIISILKVLRQKMVLSGG